MNIQPKFTNTLCQKIKGCFFWPQAALLLSSLFLIGCNPKTYEIDPCIRYEADPCYVKSLPRAFPPLTSEEKRSDWGKELFIGTHFASGYDLYRAITCFERAQILIPDAKTDRSNEIAFNTIFCYFLGKKYEEVVEIFEGSALSNTTAAFPTYKELLIILYISYQKIGNLPREKVMMKVIEGYDAELAEDLKAYDAFEEGDICQILSVCHRSHPFIATRIEQYESQALSPRKAQILNAVLPGAGYWYTGQKTTAITAFVLNAAFITATYELIKNGHVAAGVITGSLEFGWYFGGINGAGLSAKNWNDQLYSAYAKDTMIDLNLFPILQFRRAF